MARSNPHTSIALTAVILYLNSNVAIAADSSASIAVFTHQTPATHTTVLLNGVQNSLSGWSHVAKYPDEFKGLTKQLENYDIPLPTSSDRPFSVVLVKKLHNWKRQHSNGITAPFMPTAFGDIAGIELVLRINSDDSVLPTSHQLATSYGDWLTVKQLEQLDDGDVHLSVSIREAEPKDKTQARFNADYLLSIGAGEYMDQWLHVFIPVTALYTYDELNYVDTHVSLEAAGDVLIDGFKLTAETRNGKTVRHLVQQRFDDAVPHVFKEVDLELKYLAVVKHPHKD